MSKTKPNYVIVGNGHFAKHLKHYFSQLKIDVIEWERNEDNGFKEKSYVVLLAIPDNEIDKFINVNEQLLDKNAVFVHFSGIYNTEKAIRCHPLMSFNDTLYSINFYKTILFCLDEGEPSFETLFPKLPNPNIVIPGGLKPYYNNLCSLANKFTAISWEKFYDDVINNFDFDSNNIESFLNKAVSVIEKKYQAYMNGFLNGSGNFKEKLSNLNIEPVKKIYDSFLKVHNEHIAELFGNKRK